MPRLSGLGQPADAVPGAAPKVDPNSTAAWLQQYSPYKMRTPLTPQEYERATVTMRTRLTTTTTSDTRVFRNRATHSMLILSIRGHLAFNAITSETLAITGIGNPFILDRAMMKAMNCRLQLSNQDRQIPLFEGGQDLALSTILPEVGGAPIYYDPPHIVLPGQTVLLSSALQDTTGAIVGASTDYGVNLDVVFVRVYDG